MKKAHLILYLIIGLVVLPFTSVLSQNHRIDSLRKALKKKTEDTTNLSTRIQLAIALNSLNADSTVKGLLLSARIGEQFRSNSCSKTKEALSCKRISELLAHIYDTLGTIYHSNKNYLLAIEALDKEANIYSDLRHDLGKGMAICRKAQVVSDSGDHKNALIYYFAAIHSLEKFPGNQALIACYGEVGREYDQLGEPQSSLDYYQRGLIMAKQYKFKHEELAMLNNMAGIYERQGLHPKAIGYYKEAIRIEEEISELNSLAVSYNNLGILLKNEGDIDAALEYYVKSNKINRELGLKKYEANSLINIAAIQNLKGDLPQSIISYEKALEIFNAEHDKIGISTAYNNLGFVLGNSGTQENIIKALDYFEKSLSIREELKDVAGIMTCHINLSYIHYKLNHAFRSKEHGFKALGIAEKIGYPDAIRKASGRLYHAYRNSNQSDSALIYLRKMIQITDRNLSNNYFHLAEKQKELFFTTIEKDFMNYYDFAVNYQNKFSGICDTAYNLCLSNKGLILKSANILRNSILSSNNNELIRKYEDWLLVKKKIAKLYETGKDPSSEEKKAGEIESELITMSPAFSAILKTRNVRWVDVRNKLKPGEAAVEFVHYKTESKGYNITNYLALIIKKDQQHPIVVPICEETKLEQIMSAGNLNSVQMSEKLYGTLKAEQTNLYSVLWMPMEPFLSGIKRIYYSPSGLTHKISFSSICLQRNKFLCDKYQLIRLGSTGLLTEAEDGKISNDDNMLLVGGVNYRSTTKKEVKEVWNYLPGTLHEVETIETTLGKNGNSITTLSGSEATEDTLKKLAGKVAILHIATHGFFFPDQEIEREWAKKNELNKNSANKKTESNDPLNFRGSGTYAGISFLYSKNPLMRSGLVLAHGNNIWNRLATDVGEDGVLTAMEVTGLDLRNLKLAVLSACETGLGDIKGSEGVYGLQRAFKMAGTHFLIMSLWQVPDKETSEFMKLFYEQLHKTKNIREAFSESQKTMRLKYDPYYWAAFTLME